MAAGTRAGLVAPSCLCHSWSSVRLALAVAAGAAGLVWLCGFAPRQVQRTATDTAGAKPRAAAEPGAHAAEGEPAAPPPLSLSAAAAAAAAAATAAVNGEDRRERGGVQEQRQGQGQALSEGSASAGLGVRLAQARAQVADLEAAMEGIKEDGERREVNVFLEGAFDLMHYGHVNAFRLGRALGTRLIVGVNSSESISQCKGPPVMSDEERLATVKACRFVDQVVADVPYIMTGEYLSRIIREHRIDMIVHGDDACVVDGEDVYATAKKLGIYRTIPRTEGVSTSDLVGRLLLAAPRSTRVPWSCMTARMLHHFARGAREPPPGARVVYIGGSWDLFHAAHTSILRQAKQLGNYLLVGVYDDVTVSGLYGSELPVMSLHERVLSVLGCRFADDVVIGAPIDLTSEAMHEFHVTTVVQDPDCERRHAVNHVDMASHHQAAKDLGVLVELHCDYDLDVPEIARRIRGNQTAQEARYHRKREEDNRRMDIKLRGL